MPRVKALPAFVHELNIITGLARTVNYVESLCGGTPLWSFRQGRPESGISKDTFGSFGVKDLPTLTPIGSRRIVLRK